MFQTSPCRKLTMNLLPKQELNGLVDCHGMHVKFKSSLI